MQRRRILGLTLGVALALAVAVSPAIASPVFYTKVEVGGTASSPVKFSGTIGALYFEGNVSKTKFECHSGTLSGEVTGATTVANLVIVGHGCKAGSGECRSAGEPEGVLRTNALAGELGDLAPGVPGLRLFDEATGRGGELLPFSCFGDAVAGKIRGSFIAQLSGASGTSVSEGKFVASHSLKMVEKNGIQKFGLFVGESLTEQLEQKVGEGAYEKVGLSALATLTSEGPSNLGFTK